MAKKYPSVHEALGRAIKSIEIVISSLRIQIEELTEQKNKLIEERAQITPVYSEDDARQAFRRSSEFLNPTKKKE